MQLMKGTLQSIYHFSISLGYDPKQTPKGLKQLSSYFRDRKELKKQRGNDTTFKLGITSPILKDKYAQAGSLKGHYFHQDLLVARKIFENKPVKHVDVGSRTDGFVAHVAVFRPIEVLDIRELTSKVRDISFRRVDLMKLPEDMVSYCDSVSSLHAIEHFGLGRYGDPIDYFGYKKAIENIHQILKPGGTFYFSVPIGEQRIEFNAQRVFSLNYLCELLKDKFETLSFSYVNDMGDLFENVDMTNEQKEKNFDCHYGCGVFELKKR